MEDARIDNSAGNSNVFGTSSPPPTSTSVRSQRRIAVGTFVGINWFSTERTNKAHGNCDSCRQACREAPQAIGARRREPISADTIDTMQRRLQTHVFPYIGTRDVKLLTGQELLAVLRRIEERGTLDDEEAEETYIGLSRWIRARGHRLGGARREIYRGNMLEIQYPLAD